MIIMSMHLLHLQPDDSYHDTSSASPAVMVILVTTRPLHHQWCLTPHLKCVLDKNDDYDDDDDDIDDAGDKDDDSDGNCPAVIMIIM